VMGLVVVQLALVGCTDDEPPEPTPETSTPPTPIATITPSVDASATVTPDETPEPSTDCPNETSALADRKLSRPNPLGGDVDGDGIADQISLVVDPQGGPGCRAFVVVDGLSGRMVAAITEPDLAIELGLPTLRGLIGIGDVGEDEIIVHIHSGASTEFLGLFTVVDGTLLRMSVAQGDGSGALFASGGSVSHLEAIDCADANVVISSAVSKGRFKYRVERAFHAVEDAQLIPQPDLLEQRVVHIDDLGQLQEFTRTPFGSCA
jgi:hypothetical protein